MKSALALFVLALFAAPASAQEAKVNVEWKVLDFTDRANLPPVGASVKILDLTTDAQGAPATSLVKPLYARVDLGGKAVHIVLGMSVADGEAPDRVAVDHNADGTIAGDEIHEVKANERKSRAGKVVGYSALLRDVEFVIGGKTYKANLFFSRTGDQAWRARFIGQWYLEGTVKIGEKDVRLCLVDADLDGSFSGEEDLWLVTGMQPVQRPASAFSMSGRGEGRFFDGNRYELKNIEGTEITLAYVPAEGPTAEDEAAARTRVEHLWAKRFDQEREKFIEQRNLDTTRAKATTPIAWRFITVAQAKELAAKENKHLFVDVLAFWCVWCYRMDYYTYIDAEVAALMNEKYICVKVIQEQDRAGDYESVRKELGARGIPAMGIWGPDGKHVRTIGGWKRPEEFLAELRAGLAKKGEG